MNHLTHQQHQPLIGVDVAKQKLDLARSDTQTVAQFANDDDGIAALIRSLQPSRPALIVVEATGGYETRLLHALLDADMPVARVNPTQVRHFAKALGVAAKTDAIDARVLVAFARHVQPRMLEKRSKTRTELEAIVTCRRQLVAVRTEQRNRRATTASKKACRAIDAVLKTLEQQIDDLEAQIQKLIDADDDMRGLDRILRTVPGVGPMLSATLLAELIELGMIGRRQVSALVGVAPLNRDSGRHQGQRAIRGGRTSVRSVLYMAAVTAMRCNPVIQRFAARLKAAGKRNKVIITACMRKLLTILNAMIRDRVEWFQLRIVKNA